MLLAKFSPKKQCEITKQCHVYYPARHLYIVLYIVFVLITENQTESRTNDHPLLENANTPDNDIGKVDSGVTKP